MKHAATTRTELADDDMVAADLDTPIGRLRIIASSDGVCAVHFDAATAPDVARAAATTDELGVFESRASDGSAMAEEVLRHAVSELTEYFAGDRQEFTVPVAPDGTDFQRSAWSALVQIPFGATRSYAEQAALLGDRRKARAVGAANGKNPVPIIVPCHRVIGANGSLTGFAGGVDTKRWLLDHERRTLGGW